MNVRKKILIALLFFAFVIVAKAQDNPLSLIEELPNERVSVITDRDYYLAGDKLWFKGYVFHEDNLSIPWSKVLYVEIFNERQEVFIQEKFSVNKGVVSGSLDIPVNLNTGHYFLRAYTQYMRNFPVETYFTRVVSVVNPDSEASEVKIDTKEKTVLPSDMIWKDEVAGIKVDVAVDKPNYSQREKVSLTIDASMASLTVSVRKKGTTHSAEEIKEFLTRNSWLNRSYSGLPQAKYFPFDKSMDENTRVIKWAPEGRGITLSGVVKNKTTGNPVPEIYCITSVIGEEPQLHMAKTFEDGSFTFPFHELKGDRDIFVAIRGNDNRDLDILLNKDFSANFSDMKPMALEFDTCRHELFEALHINNQLNRVFVSSLKTEAYSGDMNLLPDFNIGSPDITVELKDFIEIPTLPEVFRELIPTVSVRGKIGNRRLNIFNKEAFKDLTDPLVLLDNVPVKDIDKLLQIDPGKLKKIEVFNSEYHLGDYLFEGIVSIKTSTEDFAGYKWTDNSVFLEFKGVRETEIFQHLVYKNAADLQGKKPDFRTVLYWNPEIKKGDDPVTLSFFTSDHLSEYEVVVQGYTSDGKPCYGRSEFKVTR